MKKQGFFMKGNYYLIPNEFKDFEGFIEDIKSQIANKKEFIENFKKLNEYNCKAPYFTEECITNEKVSIKDHNDIYKVDVEVMTKQEYFDRLVKLVGNHCKGCSNFIDDGNYDGFYDELSLNGVCFYNSARNDNKYYLYYGLEAFKDKFKEKREIIEGLIDKGDAELAKETIEFLIEPVLGNKPIITVISKKKKKFYCYFSPCLLEFYGHIYSIICRYMSKNIENWEFLPYIPKKSLKKCKAELPLIKFKINQESRQLEHVYLEVKDLDKIKDSHIALSNRIGESDFVNAYDTVGISYCKKGEGIPLNFNFFLKDMKLRLKLKNSKEQTFPATVGLQMRENESKVATRRALTNSNAFFPLCGELDKIKEGHEDLNKFYDFGIDFAIIKLNCNGFEEGEQIKRNIIEITKNDYGVMFGQEYSNEDLKLYLFVLNKSLFLETIRRYSPLFESYSSLLTLIEKGSIKNFKIDFDFKEI